MSKIDVAIIGVQKAGTTSLKNYMDAHPSVVTHASTEFGPFAEPDAGLDTIQEPDDWNRQRLAAFYRPYNEVLRAFVDHPAIDNWS